MSNTHRMGSRVLACGLMAALWAASGAVQAREVVWSVGVGGPGVQVGVTNAPPVLVQPQPVYWQRPAVLVHRQPVYYAAPQPVVYAQPQLVVAPHPYYRGWGPHYRGHRGHHHRGFGEGRDHDGRGRD